MSSAKPEIKYSKFVRSYSGLDPDSGITLVRIASATVPEAGFNVFSEDATLLCYSLSGEGEQRGTTSQQPAALMKM